MSETNNNSNNRKYFLGLLAFALIACILFFVWNNNKQEPVSGSKSITVEVTHGDGSEKTFTYATDEEYLGPLLLEEGLIEGSESDYGLFVTIVDGEEADYTVDGSWWKLLINGEESQTGVDTTVIEDGNVYGWEYTK